jgi:hypothetical protein
MQSDDQWRFNACYLSLHIYSFKPDMSVSLATWVRFILFVAALPPAWSLTKSVFKGTSTRLAFVLVILAVAVAGSAQTAHSVSCPNCNGP